MPDQGGRPLKKPNLPALVEQVRLLWERLGTLDGLLCQVAKDSRKNRAAIDVLGTAVRSLENERLRDLDQRLAEVAQTSDKNKEAIASMKKVGEALDHEWRLAFDQLRFDIKQNERATSALGAIVKAMKKKADQPDPAQQGEASRWALWSTRAWYRWMGMRSAA
jgi:hypothetical protein